MENTSLERPRRKWENSFGVRGQCDELDEVNLGQRLVDRSCDWTFSSDQSCDELYTYSTIYDSVMQEGTVVLVTKTKVI